MIETYLLEEIEALKDEFEKMWPKYRDSWRQMNLKDLSCRLWQELSELDLALDYGSAREIHEEAIDCALVALMIADLARRAQKEVR